MIHEEICTYEVCKLAKEKGFPQDPDKNDHSQMYCWDGLRNIHSLGVFAVWYMEEYNHENLYAAPTQSLLQRWLREKKNIVFGISPMQEMDCDYLGWCATIYKVDDDGYGLSWQEELYYDTYELALEDALKYALENLI